MTKKPFYPFIFGLYPLLFLYARNFYEVSPETLIMPVVIITLLIGAVLAVSRRFFGDMSKAGVFTAAFAVFFFSYAQISGVIYDLRVEVHGSIIGPNKVVFPLAVISLAALAFYLKRTKRLMVSAARLMNASCVALLFFFVTEISPKVVNIFGLDTRFDSGVPVSTVTAKGSAQADPDIYLIVLDAYARSDVMKSGYGYDNSDFIERLKKNGFYVADKSSSNYNATIHSLYSIFNFEYLPFAQKTHGMGGMAPGEGKKAKIKGIKDALYGGVGHNKVFEFLKKRGYTVVTISSLDFPFLRVMSDRYMEYTSVLSSFQYKMIENTPLGLVLRVNKPFWDMVAKAHRKKINYVFDALERSREFDIKTPMFVYAHIYAPHSPFVFDADGSKLETDVRLYTYEWPDTRQEGIREKCVEAYAKQARYVTARTEGCIEAILKGRDGRPVVIIVQGDHGSRVDLDWGDLERGDPMDFFCILNAYRMPGAGDKGLYSGITPVNSFRVIFNNYFGTDLPLIEDKNYVLNWNGFTLHDYTDKLREEEERR
jgi:hypothetical protein